MAKQPLTLRDVKKGQTFKFQGRNSIYVCLSHDKKRAKIYPAIITYRSKQTGKTYKTHSAQSGYGFEVSLLK